MDAAATSVTALTEEVLNKSAVLWLDADDGSPARAVWFARRDGRVLIVSGAGEQQIAPLGEEATLILTSAGDGRRLLTIRAAVEQIHPDDGEWDAAVESLIGERRGSHDGVRDRWREEATIWALRPFGVPEQAGVPQVVTSPGGQAPSTPAPATSVVTPAATATARWRPWHLRGRATRRR
ncbi:hypothetical protein [Janibacter sp. GXQ6167]|uniref:hypothetical protein n=1 Tax=Janibacter sp. GXQ6167 TaxID=3240791 RepID=UPI00352657EF